MPGVTFRDDRDALLARADALEREAERLRRENDRLREDTPPTTPAFPTSELTLELSLQWRTSNRIDWLLVVPMLAGALGITWAMNPEGAGGVVVWVLAVLLWVSAWLAVSVVVRTGEIRRERLWIDRAPFGLDPSAYRRLLSEQHAARAVTARITFEDPAREPLVITSPRLETVRARKSVVFHDNAKVHAWVHGLVEDQLEPLAREHAIASLEIADAPAQSST